MRIPFGLSTKPLKACQVPSGNSECFSLICWKEVSKISLIFLQQILSGLWKPHLLKMLQETPPNPKAVIIVLLYFQSCLDLKRKRRMSFEKQSMEGTLLPFGYLKFPMDQKQSCVTMISSSLGFSTRKPTHTSKMVSFLLG